MKKPIKDCADLRDFLSANYCFEDLKIFAEDCEAFLQGGMDIAFDLWNYFHEEIHEWCKDYSIAPDSESFYSEKCQKVMLAIQDMSEKLVFEMEESYK